MSGTERTTWYFFFGTKMSWTGPCLLRSQHAGTCTFDLSGIQFRWQPVWALWVVWRRQGKEHITILFWHAVSVEPLESSSNIVVFLIHYSSCCRMLIPIHSYQKALLFFVVTTFTIPSQGLASCYVSFISSFSTSWISQPFSHFQIAVTFTHPYFIWLLLLNIPCKVEAIFASNELLVMK